MPYKPSPPPIVNGQHAMAEYVYRELRRLGIAIEDLERRLSVCCDGHESGGDDMSTSADYLTFTDQTGELPNSRRLVAGANVTLDFSNPAQVAIVASYPTPPDDISDKSYVTFDDESGDLPNARRLFAGNNISFSASAAGININAVSPGGGGITIDDVRAALDADSEFRAEVIGTYWPGIVTGTGRSSEERQANAVALQEAIDYCVAYRRRFRLVRAVIEIESATGIQIRTIGVDNTTGEPVAVGAPNSTTTAPTGFTWIAPLSAEIHQYASNAPILTIATTDTFGIDFYGCTLHYGNDEGANTNSNACVLGPIWLCRIGGLRVANTTTNNLNYRAFYNAQSSFFFSNHIYDCKFFKSTYSLIEIQSVGTGNLWDNVYISAVSSSGTASACQFPLRYQGPSFGQAHGNVFSQFNIEWTISAQLMQIANIRGITFNGVHFERNRLSGSNACFVLSNISDINFNGLMALDNEWSLATGNPSWFRAVNDVGILVNGMSFRVNSASYLDRDIYMMYQPDANGWDNTPAKLTIHNLKMQDTGSVIAQHLKIDRTIDIGENGALGLQGVQQVWSCPEPGSKLRGAEFTRNYASVLYGACAEDAFMKYPGSMSNTQTLGLSMYMGAPGTRQAGVPNPRGMQFGLRRSAGTGAGMLVVMNLESGVTLTAMVTGANNIRPVFDGSQWVLGGAKGVESQMVRYASGTVTVQDYDDVLIVDAGSSTATVNLPAIASSRNRPLRIKKADGTANPVIVEGSGSETVDGLLRRNLATESEVMRLVGGATEWHVM